jgi:HEAT repeat protein
MDGARNRHKAKEPGDFDPTQTKSLDGSESGEPRLLKGNDADSFSSLENAATPEEWASRTTLEVIKLLQSKNVVEAALAAKEFRRRGFAELHHRFAEQLTSPDPQVRQKFAESLPLVGNVDVRPWLIWLSQDEDSDVRMAAVSIMATRDDAEFRKRLRQLEYEESNPEVLKQIRRTQR